MALNCEICRIYSDENGEEEEDYVDHKRSLQHCFNILLYNYNNHRQRFLNEGKDDVNVNATLAKSSNLIDFNYDCPNIRIKTSLAGLKANSNLIDVDLVLKNISNSFITLTQVNFLHPVETFHYHDITSVIKIGKYARLEAGAIYKLQLKFYLKSPVIGDFRNTFSLTLQKDHAEKVFYVSREIFVNISDIKEREEDNLPGVIFGKEWGPFKLVPCKKDNNDYLKKYPVPEYIEAIVTMVFNKINPYTSGYHKYCQELKYLFQELNENNYEKYFHTLLYLDEVAQILNLRKYNMENATVTVKSEKIFELTVPGLAEKRPSLIPGDRVYLKKHLTNKAYCGIITRINDDNIWMQDLEENFMMSFEHTPTFQADVQFNINRLTYVRQHEGIDNCKSLMGVLFPKPFIHPTNVNQLKTGEFVQDFIANNKEQNDVVCKILASSRCRAPYIVFGPPGTGKTVTIVEAILQIKKRFPKAKILICAPSNAACDNIALKLKKHCNKNEMIRIRAENLDWKLAPSEILSHCNIENGMYVPIKRGQIKSYKIVITTLILCGKYFGSYSADYVFIDEAAQASEPECLIPISLMKSSSKLILCGDPKQLGPISHIKKSTFQRIFGGTPDYLKRDGNRFGLGKSLLDRLEISDIYHICTCYTMLKQNFRSHISILKIPNNLFYDKQLQASSVIAQNDRISTIPFYLKAFPEKQRCKTSTTQAIEFCSILGNEKRQGNSPSYFNNREIEAVISYVKVLISNAIDQSDIGIISPYIRQVCKIRLRLRDMGCEKIEIGSTEAFQGREKRVIIISTVRGKDNLLLHDKEYNLGFVSCERRFNVAITRAKTKLIIIGNPNILQYSRCFKMIIKQCIASGSYYGAPYVERGDNLMYEIMSRMEGMDH